MGSKGTNTYTTNSQGPAWLQSAYQGVVGQAQAASQTPFVPYGGQEVAPVNAQEFAGIGGINNYANAAQPYLNTAGAMTSAAGAPITQAAINYYANPYTSTVAGSTIGEMENLNAQQLQSVAGNAISAGAFGGDREAVAASEVAGQQAAAEAPTIANIESQGYTTGISTAEQQQQEELAAGASLGNIGTAVQQAGLTGAGAQIQGGQLEQATQQASDTQAMTDYYTKLGYPFQTASWLAGIESGIGGVAGGTSTTTAPAPNPLNAILGIGATAAGAYMGAHAKGGGIHVPHLRKYADGGGPAGSPIFGGQGMSFFGSPQLPRTGSGPPQPPINPSYMLMMGARDGQGAPGSSGFGDIGKAIGKYYGSRGQGIDTSGAGSGFPMEGSDDAATLSVPYDDSYVGGIGSAATGGGVLPESAGMGFAGDDPIVYDPSEQNPMDPGGARNPIIFDPAQQNPMDPGGVRSINPPPSGKGDQPPDAPFTPRGGPLSMDTLGLTGAGHDSLEDEPLPPDPGAPRSVVAGSYRTPYGPQGGINVNQPSELNPTGGIGQTNYRPNTDSYTGPSYSDAATRPEDTRSIWNKMSVPLMQAGFALMASRSPFLGVGIGEGGLAGINAYVQQEREKRTAEEKQQDIALHAKQLSDEAEQHRENLQQAQERTGYERLANGQLRPIPGGPADPEQIGKIAAAKGENIVPVINPDDGTTHFFDKKKGTFIDVPGPTGAPGSVPQGPGGATGGNQVAQVGPTGDGFVLHNSQLVSSGTPVNYGRNAPQVEQGTPVPDPAPVGGKSSQAIIQAANDYLQTGKLPAGWAVRGGASPMAVQQSLAANSAINYASALAASRGMKPEDVITAWRSAPLMGRFITGPIGNQTVSLGTAMRHLDTIQKLGEEWDKATISGNWQTVRQLQAALMREYGSDVGTNLESAARIVGPEIVKAIGVAGAGTAGERAGAESQFTTASSARQLIGAVATTKGLLRGQITGKEAQAQAAGVPHDTFVNMVGKEQYDELHNITAGGGGGDNAAPQQRPEQIPPEKRDPKIIYPNVTYPDGHQGPARWIPQKQQWAPVNAPVQTGGMAG